MYIIYADIESLIEKIDHCKNNLEKSSTIKKEKLILCGYSMSTIWTFDHKENKQSLYCGVDWIKKFCESLREHTKKCNWFWKEKMLPLT